jgi:hypothetical protein
MDICEYVASMVRIREFGHVCRGPIFRILIHWVLTPLSTIKAELFFVRFWRFLLHRNGVLHEYMGIYHFESLYMGCVTCQLLFALHNYDISFIDRGVHRGKLQVIIYKSHDWFNLWFNELEL